MNFMFDVYVGNTNRPLSEAHANITLPATPYQLLDAMDRLQIKNPEDEYYQIEDYYDCEFLSSYLHGKASLTQLNTLSQKLSEMEEWRKDALEGLLKMDALKENRLPSIERVIDLAHSTDSCQVLYEARNDEQLGRFYAENGFIPEVEDISDEVFEMLDFEMLGRKMRTEENGVFTQAGYIVCTGELSEVAKDMDFQLKQPDYTVLLEVSRGYFNDPTDNCEKTILLELPIPREKRNEVPELLESASWEELGFHVLDCAVPQAMDWIEEAGDIEGIESFASDLKLLQDEGSLTKYKAVLKATQCGNYQTAVQLIETLDAYLFSPRLDSPEAIAKEELKNYMDDDVEQVLPYVNLWGYGNALLEKFGSALTEYGLVDRADFLPILENVGKPEQDEIEMSM